MASAATDFGQDDSLLLQEIESLKQKLEEERNKLVDESCKIIFSNF